MSRLRFSIGVPMRNARWAKAYDIGGCIPPCALAHGWSDSTANSAPSHSYDPLGFGKQRLTATAGIAYPNVANYIQYTTPALRAPGAAKYGIGLVVQTNQTGPSPYIYYNVASQPSTTWLFTPSNVQLSGTDPEILILNSANSVGNSTDTSYNIRIGISALLNGNWIEFSRTICLFHTWETDANYYQITPDPLAADYADGAISLAQWHRRTDGYAGVKDNSGGARKIRRNLTLEYVQSADQAVLHKLWAKNRPNAAQGGYRPLVVYDTLLRAPKNGGVPAVHCNPGYFNWIGRDFPFSWPTPGIGWRDTDPDYSGTIPLEEV